MFGARLGGELFFCYLNISAKMHPFWESFIIYSMKKNLLRKLVEILEDDNVYGGTCGLLGARPSKAQKCAISFSEPIFSLQLHRII